MDSLVTFGTLFEYNNKQYIFLARTEEVIYAGQILDEEKTKWLQQLCDDRVKKNRDVSRPLYCFVILSTEEMKDRAAFLGGQATMILT